MNKIYFIKTAIVLIAFFSLSASSQNSDDLWSIVSQTKAKQSEQVFRKIELKSETFFQLNLESLKSKLLNIGNRENQGNTIISFPNSDGKLNKFRVFEASIMDEELQAQNPNMRSYSGQGIDNPSEIIRFSITPKGFHAMFLGTVNGTQFIDPFSVEGNIYSVYAKRNLSARNFDFECSVIDDPLLDRSNRDAPMGRNANDGMLRDYRIAIACTGEYAAFHGGTAAGALAAMVVTMTRVNGIYERDLSVTMTMVDNTDIIFTNAITDPFNNDDANTLIDQSQSVIDTEIGSANYDVGHTFSTGGGGLASQGVCNDTYKASGITGSPQPVGDSFDIDFVAHELGHQFGAPHTFNGTVGNCAGGNRSSGNAYEPGSGSTIMAYAGICGSDNVQSNSDTYFHQNSLNRMWTHITNAGTCPVTRSSTGNSEPVANAGGNYTIPQGTPYILDGSSSTDVDGMTSLTYTWEQYDLGPAGVPTETTSAGPLVRSFEGTGNPNRYVPRLVDVLSNGGTSTTWEKLAMVDRPINFKLTVRDNDAAGGQTDSDEMTATVTTAAGPFTVTSQNVSSQSWDIGTTQTITWNVAGTTGNGINELNVDILLATDGLNYDTILASNVGNNGSHDITVPNVSSTKCRIMVRGSNNIFFNINTQDISIGATEVCTTYASASTLNIAIPDGLGANENGAPISSVITIPAGENVTIESIKVNVDVTHTYIQDLYIQLNHPSSTEAVPVLMSLWNRDCDGENDLDVTFEAGAAAITCAEPTIGTFAPSGDLSIFNGLDSAGDWTLLIADFYNGDLGTLNDWSIEVCYTTNLSVTGVELENLNIYPNPNNGEFNIGFNPKSGDDITIDVYDIRGRTIFNKTYSSVSRFEEAIQLSNAQSGVYMLMISDGQQKVTKKIIVE